MVQLVDFVFFDCNMQPAATAAAEAQNMGRDEAETMSNIDSLVMGFELRAL